MNKTFLSLLSTLMIINFSFSSYADELKTEKKIEEKTSTSNSEKKIEVKLEEVNKSDSNTTIKKEDPTLNKDTKINPNTEIKLPKTEATNINQVSQKSVAILDFENNTGLSTQDNLKKAFADTLTTSLSNYSNFIIVERTRLKDAIGELNLGQAGFISQESAIKIGKTTGSKYVILGSLSKVGDVFELSTRIVDIESSKIISAKSVRCYEEEVFLRAIDYLSMEIAESLGEKINKNEILSKLKNDIESYRKGNMNWLIWTGAGLLLAGAGVATYFIIKNNEKKTSVVNKPCLPPLCKTPIAQPIIEKPILNQKITQNKAFSFSTMFDGININFSF